MRKILFPTDFSKAANNAFIYALNLAKELEAEIFVLHTYIQPVLSATHAGQPELVPEIYENFELQQFENFKTHSNRLRELASEQALTDINLTFLFHEGTVISNVDHVVAKEKIQLIVMGTNRADGIIDKIFGSNTLSVLRGVKIPVLSVPLEASYRGIKEIIFTTMFREKDEKPLSEILKIAACFDIKVKCLHVHKDKNLDIIALASRWEKMFNQKNLEFIFLEYEESIENSINKYIDSNRVDLLCLVKRNRNLLERLFTSSMSNKLRMHTNTASLILHEGNHPGNF